MNVWFDPEGDFLEVIFEQKAGHFRETSDDQVMKKVDSGGRVIGFNVLRVSALKNRPIAVKLAS